MSAIVPLKVMLASAVPSPAEKVRPVVELNVTVPSGAVRVSCTGAAAASMSDMAIGLPPAVENTIGLSVVPVCAGGTVMVGASLAAVTSIVIVRGIVSR